MDTRTISRYHARDDEHIASELTRRRARLAFQACKRTHWAHATELGADTLGIKIGANWLF